jgi:hypothetical protein
MKINFQVPIIDVDGKPLRENGNGEELVLGKVLAHALRQFVDFDDIFKLMETWAMPMYAGKPIEFDTADLELFKRVVKNKKLGLFPITEYAALKLIREAELKEAKEAEAKGAKK